ncbi:MAG: hypothetical protein AAF846_20645 [Chloroflexota bacterium]
MAFRIHLTNQAIHQLNVLPGKNAQLVAWTRRNQAQLYDLKNGTFLEEITLGDVSDVARNSDEWLNFLSQTKAPNSQFYLPRIQTPFLDMLSSDDGALRVYRLVNDQLFIEADGVESELALIGGIKLISIDLDGALGTFVGLDENLKLHIYQQNIRVGTFDIGLQRDGDLRANVMISRGGNAIYATDGRRLVYVDTGGTVHKTLETHYFIGRMAASPNGGMVVTSDMESGVLRVYRGDRLVLTHQKFAMDLVAMADQVQLMADLPPRSTAISAMTASNKGIFAFAISGVICVTDVKAMDEVPRPKTLL